MADRSSQHRNYVEWFRKTTPYINAHRDKRFVIHIDGETIDTPDFQPICQDISLLNSLGIELVVVFGLRPQIDTAFAKHAIESKFKNDIRITPHDSMIRIEEVAGRIRGQIEATLSMGLPNTPMEGSKIRVISGNMITARPIGVRQGVDFLYSGRVRRVQTESVKALLGQKAVVLIPPIGVSSTGETFNMNSSEVALSVATALKADKLIFITRHLPSAQLNNITPSNQALPRELTSAQATQLINDNHVNLTIAALLSNSIEACKNGVSRTHLLDSTHNGVLLEELFTPDGIGTLLTRTNYEILRTATISDIPGMLDIIMPLETKGFLIPRARENIELEIGNYIILERDNFVIATAGLFHYPEENCAEVGCFAIGINYQNQGRGKTILRQIETIARSQEIKQLFVITTQTTHWFIEQGFSAAPFSALPRKKRESYNSARNPKVLFKSLAPLSQP